MRSSVRLCEGSIAMFQVPCGPVDTKNRRPAYLPRPHWTGPLESSPGNREWAFRVHEAARSLPCNVCERFGRLPCPGQSEPGSGGKGPPCLEVRKTENTPVPPRSTCALQTNGLP